MSEVVMLIFPSRETMLDAVDRIKSLSYAKMTHSALMAKAEDGEPESTLVQSLRQSQRSWRKFHAARA